MFKLSVCICAHNPREDYLRKTLEALDKQTLPKGQWELLLIDNASREPLQDKWELSWHPNARHIREEKLGLTPARLRGIQESQGGILVFVDDDCELSPDYLQSGVFINERHPRIGAWGGQCWPVFEVEPPEWSKPYLGHLTIRHFEEERWSNIFERDTEMPWGAGIFLRKEVALAYIHKATNNVQFLQLGRRGGSLMACEDLAMVFCCRDVGMGFGIFPQLNLNHLIPSARVSEDYFLKVVRGHAFSWILLQNLEGFKNIPPKIGFIRRWLGKWRRKLTMNRRDRLFLEAKLDACQEAATLLSKPPNS